MRKGGPPARLGCDETSEARKKGAEPAGGELTTGCDFHTRYRASGPPALSRGPLWELRMRKGGPPAKIEAGGREEKGGGKEKMRKGSKFM